MAHADRLITVLQSLVRPDNQGEVSLGGQNAFYIGADKLSMVGVLSGAGNIRCRSGLNFGVLVTPNFFQTYYAGVTIPEFQTDFCHRLFLMSEPFHELAAYELACGQVCRIFEALTIVSRTDCSIFLERTGQWVKFFVRG